MIIPSRVRDRAVSYSSMGVGLVFGRGVVKVKIGLALEMYKSISTKYAACPMR